ncbi:predicted protein [Nematostella vectensis]|uniref:Clarin-3 n=1 Tax=Nematostella vectensis TaxID=45351 RepID=A7SGP9_NEMVE|nr:clarin-3 [Nematostella vectensis]EDO37104.1 predicted protein [Nematostella vectensis]|eukprot:XP_001629167.1 predicted protein [Nematostella vectensis]
MAKVFKRKGMGLFSAIIALAALVLIIVAIITEYWVMADLQRTVLTNGTAVSQTGGSKTFGLFKGTSSKDYGLGNRQRNFDVKEEFEEVANNKVVWATVGFCALSLPFICFGLGMACYNEFSKPNLMVLGTLGVFVMHIIALVFLLTAACLYATLFETQLKRNVLRKQDQQDGFSSTDRARLGYSYWILLGSAALVIISPLALLLSKIHVTHYFKTNKPKEMATADGVMLY